MYVGLVPHSQLSVQSVDFSISLSELLLNLGTPSIHLCLQQPTVCYISSESNLYYVPVLNSPAAVEVEIVLQLFGSIHRNNSGNSAIITLMKLFYYNHRFLLSVFAVLSAACQFQHPSLGFGPV